MLIALALDSQLAGHVAIALHCHRGMLERTGRPCPPGLADLERLAAEVVKSEQERAGASIDPGDNWIAAYAGNGDRAYLTASEYAAERGVHVSTVRRWISSGELTAERVGRTIRIPRKVTI